MVPSILGLKFAPRAALAAAFVIALGAGVMAADLVGVPGSGTVSDPADTIVKLQVAADADKPAEEKK